jgi:LmbE family N-acetylglucosaminyl deacetylase
MHVEDLRQIHDSYEHVYLSPHLDDAALSCGGAIATNLAQGARVLIVTLCTAAPPPEGPFNAVAREFHGQWNLEAADVLRVRLAEDRLAMERLGADYFWAGLLDAIYRVPDAYNSRETLFNTPVPADSLFADLRRLCGALRARVPHATFYAPLGIGNHVDHLITYDVACETAQPSLAFYEDVHYVLQPGAREQRLAALGARHTPQVIAIDHGLACKISAIAAYESQVRELFGGSDPMARAITDYASSLMPESAGYGERVWMRESPALAG